MEWKEKVMIMRKKLFAIFMITALITVFGPLELFAGTEDGTPSDTNTEIVVDTPEEGGEDVTADPAAPATDGENGEIGNGEDVDPNALPAGNTNEEGNEDGENEVLKAASTAPRLENLSYVATDKTATLSWSYLEGEALAEEEVLTIWNGDDKVGEITDASVTSFTVENLERLTDYTFVFKIGDDEEGSIAVSTTATQISLKALSSYNSVVLKWDAVEGASEYVVTYSGNGIPEGTTLYKGSANTVTHKGLPTYDVTNTSSGPIVKTDYTYSVRAYDADGMEIGASAEVKGYAVRTMYYTLKFKKAATLTSHSGGKKKITFKKNQVVYARGFDGGKFIFDYKCPDGVVRTYYTMKIRVNASIWTSHINNSREYSAEEATLYVNARGITSKKKYMVWVNTYTQREYVFQGSAGRWTLVKGPWLVSTGKASKPTATGSTNISVKKKSKHGIPTWNMCRYFSLHGKKGSWVLGWPRSGACVRNYNANAKWIYNTCPLKTRVFVF